MRALFIIDSLGTGGAERSTLDFCLHLKDSNNAVKIICLRQRYEGVQTEALASGLKVHFVSRKNLLLQLLEINSVCREFRPDLVHSILFKSRLRGKLHKLLFFKKHLLFETLVNIPFADSRLRRTSGRITILLHRFMESVLARLAVNHFIAISETVKRHFVNEVFFLKPEKMSVIYRGRAGNEYLDQREPLRLQYSRELGYAKDAIVFIHIGRQDFQKNHEFLITAFQKLLEKNHSKKELVLLCLGRKGDMSDRIDRLLSNRFSGNILFLGHRNDVPRLLAQSDIFVFPSIYEGVGGAIIEAKAARLPVIVSNLGVFNEVLEENKEGFFVDLKNMDEFVQKMDLLAADDSLRFSMGRENLKSFQENFSNIKINKELEALYNRFLTKARGEP